MAAHQVGADQGGVHHAPGEVAGVELGGRGGPGPGAHHHEGAHAALVAQRAGQAGWTAPVVADHGDAGEVELADQRDEIGGMAIERVGVLAGGFFREAEADHVGDDDAAAGRHDRADDIAVEKAPGGVAVQQHDGIALAFVHVVHAPAVDLREAWRVRPFVADEGRQLGGQMTDLARSAAIWSGV